MVSLFVYSLEQWKQNKLAFLRQLLVLAHARNISSTPLGRLVVYILSHVCVLYLVPVSLPPPAEPARYEIYKPMCILFALVDGLHHALKVVYYKCKCHVILLLCFQVSVKSTGKELPHALLEYIRNNDTAVLEDCDKVPASQTTSLLL